jgi:uncharacterized membrane protein YheB (UPF0754 family)
MTSAFIYSLRFAEKLSLPAIIQENIAKLRISPAAYRPIRPIKPRYVRRRPEDSDNWRERILVDYIKRVREVTDPSYDSVFEIFNKITNVTMKKLSEECLTILKTQDEQFRLRVTTLLFDRAIKGSAYAAVMADLAQILNTEIPDVADDLETHVKMFSKLYNMNDTLVFPTLGEGFEDKVIEWSKQKDVRRGYSRFMAHLYSRGLIPANLLHESMMNVISDLETTAVQTKTEKLEEIVTQYADFLFEIARILPPTAVELRGLLQTRLSALLSKPRGDVPSMNMRSRFKIEDTEKCVRAG